MPRPFPPQHVEQTLSRLRLIRWADAPAPATERTLDDARAHLRAFAEFVRHCRSVPSQNDPMPFTLPSRVLGMPDTHLSASVVAESEALAAHSRNAWDVAYVRQSLDWAALCDSAVPAAMEREGALDPLLRLLESRVPATVRQGYWVVDQDMFPLANWLTRYGPESAP